MSVIKEFKEFAMKGNMLDLYRDYYRNCFWENSDIVSQ